MMTEVTWNIVQACKGMCIKHSSNMCMLISMLHTLVFMHLSISMTFLIYFATAYTA